MGSPSIDRSRRVGGLIQRELSALIASELGDPRVDGVTITDVKLTRDLRYATIFVSRLDEAREAISLAPAVSDEDAPKPKRGRRGVFQRERVEGEEHEYVAVLNKASGVLRRHLGVRMKLRSTPELNFRYDDTIARGFRISRLIDESLGDEQSGDDGKG